MGWGVSWYSSYYQCTTMSKLYRWLSWGSRAILRPRFCLPCPLPRGVVGAAAMAQLMLGEAAPALAGVQAPSIARQTSGA